MPKPSNATDCSSPDRVAIASHLYISRGATDASTRCQLNSEFGSRDLVAELLAELRLKQGDFLLDVGCGAGQHLVNFGAQVGDSGRVLGVDYSQDAITQACARGQAGVVASGARLPLRDGTVDALTCNYAIYYFNDISAVLAELRRVLRPGGRMVLSGPARGSNRELYAFHLAATGSEPSDADGLALGFVDDVVAKLLPSSGFESIHLDGFENPVTFPDAKTFLDYWTATSLFARTSGATREMGEACFRDSGKQEVVITKCVSLLSAVRTTG